MASILKRAMFDLKDAKIAVMGLDRDGLSLAIRAASHGFETVGVRHRRSEGGATCI